MGGQDEHSWKDLILQDQLISKDKEIESLIDLIKVKDEQIHRYQDNAHELNCIIKSLSDQRISPLALNARDEDSWQSRTQYISDGDAAVREDKKSYSRISLIGNAVAAAVLLMVITGYVKLRNEYVVLSNEALCQTERLDVQREALAEKQQLLTHTNSQITSLHSQLTKVSSDLSLLERKNATLLEDNALLASQIQNKQSVLEKKEEGVSPVDVAVE